MPNFDDDDGRIQDRQLPASASPRPVPRLAPGSDREDFGTRSVVEVEASDVGAATDAAFGVVCRMADDGTTYYRSASATTARMISASSTARPRFSPATADGWSTTTSKTGLDQYDVTAWCLRPRLALRGERVVLAEVRDTTLDRATSASSCSRFDEAEAEVASPNFTGGRPRGADDVAQASVDAWQEFFVRTPVEVAGVTCSTPTVGATKDPLLRTSCEGADFSATVGRRGGQGLRSGAGHGRHRARPRRRVPGLPEAVRDRRPSLPWRPPGKITYTQDSNVRSPSSGRTTTVGGRTHPHAGDEPDFQANFGPSGGHSLERRHPDLTRRARSGRRSPATR